MRRSASADSISVAVRRPCSDRVRERGRRAVLLRPQAAEEARAVGGYVKAAPARAAHAVAEETRAIGSFVQRAARATASAIMSKL